MGIKTNLVRCIPYRHHTPSPPAPLVTPYPFPGSLIFSGAYGKSAKFLGHCLQNIFYTKLGLNNTIYLTLWEGLAAIINKWNGNPFSFFNYQPTKWRRSRARPLSQTLPSPLAFPSPYRAQKLMIRVFERNCMKTTRSFHRQKPFSHEPGSEWVGKRWSDWAQQSAWASSASKRGNGPVL